MEPFIGEVRMFAGNFAPVGWAFCNGDLLSVSENEALFGLIGSIYGGDWQTTFALPDLRGRLPLHQGVGGGSTYQMSDAGGTESVILTTDQLPTHSHAQVGSSAPADGANPNGQVFSAGEDTPFYSPVNPSQMATMSSQVVQSTGASQPHDNMQPYLCVSFIIALKGIYPTYE